MTLDKSKPFDYAQDVTKQLITLSTGVVAITVTFLYDIVQRVPESGQISLFVGWSLFLLSIISGIATLLNLTGRVGNADNAGSTGVYEGVIRLFSAAQIILFLLALGATAVFGLQAVHAKTENCTVTTTKVVLSRDHVSSKTVSTRSC